MSTVADAASAAASAAAGAVAVAVSDGADDEAGPFETQKNKITKLNLNLAPGKLRIGFKYCSGPMRTAHVKQNRNEAVQKC